MLHGRLIVDRMMAIACSCIRRIVTPSEAARFRAVEVGLEKAVEQCVTRRLRGRWRSPSKRAVVLVEGVWFVVMSDVMCGMMPFTFIRTVLLLLYSWEPKINFQKSFSTGCTDPVVLPS